ncbi:superoxide dismutase [Marivibrio halodurans]|uniref:Superoxide dismutase n=1 Tax=Marivibrio halodurans TaxID=2039722 RepID=A0A8J7S5U1_9PROT|nr:superoxide dismutase [Marivibrio halodurans]MBP5856117.1 superoxide dismutase [Marivibrio halodurans]
MAIELPDLPYDKSALAPHISADTLTFHHDKHHNAYVTKTNELITGTELSDASIEEIAQAAHDKGDQGLFNQSAQVWNHTFYWNSMSPNGGGAPTGDIADKIKEDFGSFEEFANAFKNAGATQFGSGWAWLVLDGGKLTVEKTLNADTPLVHGKTPLITMDVWEHAYYLDYQNRRPDYMGAFLEHLINWDFANKNLKAA